MTETITIKQKITRLPNNFHRVRLEVSTEAGASFVSTHEYENKSDIGVAYRTLLNALAGLSDCTVAFFSDCAEVVRDVMRVRNPRPGTLLAKIRTRQERYNIAFEGGVTA